MTKDNAPEVIEGNPPNKSGVYQEFGLKWFTTRDDVPKFIARKGYSCGYTFTNDRGERVLALCQKDFIGKDER